MPRIYLVCERNCRSPQSMLHVLLSLKHGLYRGRNFLLVSLSPDMDMSAKISSSLYQPSGADNWALKYLATISMAPRGRWVMVTMTSSIVEALSGSK